MKLQHFFDSVSGDTVTLNRENSHHIINALRMKIGEQLCVCDNGTEYFCTLTDVSESLAVCRVDNKKINESEPDVKVTLFQCVPKGDKLETVIQKAVELGVNEIVPVLSSRCVSRPDEKKSAKKSERYNKIAKSACEQSGRGTLVPVLPQITLKEAATKINEFDISILFYEGGGSRLREIIEEPKSICIFIGPEGGFDKSEVKMLCECGAQKATLGKRILRTETAPLAALSAVMLLTGNLE